jgi:hypothetical protein
MNLMQVAFNDVRTYETKTIQGVIQDCVVLWICKKKKKKQKKKQMTIDGYLSEFKIIRTQFENIKLFEIA